MSLKSGPEADAAGRKSWIVVLLEAIVGGPEGLAEWRKSWPVVLAAAIGVGLMSTPSYSVGLFTQSLSEEFGWKRASIASGLMFSAVAAIVLGPFIGMVIDRTGPRRIAIAGSALVITGFVLMSQTNDSLWSWYAIWTFMAFASVLIKPMVWTSAVSSLFATSRGLALAATLCGTSLASTFTPFFCTWLIRTYDWRTAYLGLAGFYAVVLLPVLFFLFTSALDRKRTSAPKDAPKEKIVLPGVGAKEGLLSWRFLRLNIAAATMVLVGANTTINFVPIMTSFGHPALAAASVAGLAGLSTIAGRMIGGYLLDRISGNIVAGVSVTMPIFSTLLLLLFPDSLTAAGAAALIVGFSLGAELDAVAYLTTRHFGLKSFGFLFGIVGATLSLATAVGPMALGHVYDVYQSYVPALWAFIPLCLLGATLFFTLGRYPDFGEAGLPSGEPMEGPGGAGLRPAPAAH